MRFVIYGAGAVGGLIGGRLAQYGNDVVLITRGEHLATIRAHGLTIASPADTVTINVPAVEAPSEVAWRGDDVVVLTMQSQDTEQALAALEAAAGCHVPVICVQNGVENERLALRRFARVYATAMIMVPATRLVPGRVHADSAPISGVLDTGCYPQGTDSLCEEWCAALARSTFSAKPDPRPMFRKYGKLLRNLRNALQVICGPDADYREFVQRAREEGIACYRAAGIEFTTAEEDRERQGSLIRVAPIMGGGQKRSGGSSWQSLRRGKTTIEADYLNGEICLLGRLHGIPTPVNELLQETANRFAREGRQPGSMTVAELRAQLRT
jgi:2-dehydropantoate 2-reductase